MRGMVRDFDHFVCIDWSGEAVARPKGLAVAHCVKGGAAPVLLRPSGGWSRGAILDWLIQHAEVGTNMLIGLDFSPALPFADRAAYLPGFEPAPQNAHELWKLVADMCGDEPHLAANSFCNHPEISRHFRRQMARETITGDYFAGGSGRLRRTEQRLIDAKAGNPASCFNLVGAKQVGKSSLTGMRLLHQLEGRVPIWPIDPLPSSGPVLVEIYTGIAAIAAGLPRNRTKIRDGATLDEALSELGSDRHTALASYDDHSTDAILTAAWLRSVAPDDGLWHPSPLNPDLAKTEGWTFGVP